MRSGTAYDYDLGRAIADLKDAVAESAMRHTPNKADVTRFKNLNESYAMFSRVRDAASRVGADMGEFSPAQLHAAVRAGDKSAGKGTFAKGRAPLQDLSDPARSVMTRRVSDSGTPERAALLAALVAPSVALKAALPFIGPAALYTRPGSAAARMMMAGLLRGKRTGATRRAIRRATEMAANVGAPGAGGAASAWWNGDE